MPYMNSYTFVDFNCIVQDEILIVKITTTPQCTSDTFWKITIKKDGIICKSFDFANEELCSMHLTDSGMYLVQVQVKNNNKIYQMIQKGAWYYTREFREEFASFLAEPLLNNNNKLPLYTQKYPYQNLAIISYTDKHISQVKSTVDNLNDINSELMYTNLNEFEERKNIVISSLPQANERIFFSGKTKYKGKFIVGQDDILNDVDYLEMLDEIGISSSVYSSDKSILMRNDYFGMYALFYYYIDGMLVASNNYHLLLLLLCRIGVNLTFDVESTLPYFMASERMFLEQAICHSTNIDEIKQLPIHSCIEIDAEGVHIKDKSIKAVLDEKLEYSPKLYEELLDKSAKEIVDNVKMVLEDERFEYVICDVTGGKDSRTVLAALTNVGEGYKDKIRINSKDVKSTNDVDIFIGLNNIYDFDYDDLSAEYKMVEMSKKDVSARSSFMGTSYSRPVSWDLEANSKGKIKNIVNLTGAGGDASLRPSFSSYFPDLQYDDQEKLVKQFANYYVNSIVNYSVCERSFKKMIRQAFSEIHASNLHMKLNHHYLYFRNVYHFGIQTILDSQEGGSEQWQPLQSKAAFKTHNMMLRVFGNTKFQFDLIAKLNPLLAVLPFESKSDMAEKAKIKDTLIVDQRFKDITIHLNDDRNKWEQAKKSKASSRKIVNSSDELKEILLTNSEKGKALYNDLVVRFRELMQYKDGVYKDLIGIDLYYWIKCQEKSVSVNNISRSVRFIYNKIVSVIDQINIIENK